MSKRWRRKRRKQVKKHQDLLVKEKLSGIVDTSHKHDWKREVKISQGYICPVCGKSGTDSSMDIHHLIPKCKKGGNCKDNVVAWHKVCHRNYHQRYGTRVSDRYGNPL